MKMYGKTLRLLYFVFIFFAEAADKVPELPRQRRWIKILSSKAIIKI